MNIVAIDRDGHHGAASTTHGKTYLFMSEEMATPVEELRLWVPLAAE
jgi:hypothetical protein